MFDIRMINMGSAQPGVEWPPEPVPLSKEYRSQLERELTSAGITNYGYFFADIEQAIAHYLHNKKRGVITPPQIRKAHKEAIAAVAKAEDKLRTLYDIGKFEMDGGSREASHTKCLTDMLDYLHSMQPEIDALPDRIPKTFHERELARTVLLALPATKPEQVSATVGGVFEEVLRTVFEIVGYSTGNIHRMAIQAVQDAPSIFVDPGKLEKQLVQVLRDGELAWIETPANKVVRRGVKRKRN